jgi:hypothetical protein
MMTRTRRCIVGATGVATVLVGGAVVNIASSSPDFESSVAALPPASYQLVGGTAKSVTSPRDAMVDTKNSVAVKGYYNESGSLCVVMTSHDGKSGWRGARRSAPMDGRFLLRLSSHSRTGR